MEVRAPCSAPWHEASGGVAVSADSFFKVHPTLADVERAQGSGPWWFACREPERPHGPFALYAWECPACVIAFNAARHHTPDDPIIDVYGGVATVTTFAASQTGAV